MKSKKYSVSILLKILVGLALFIITLNLLTTKSDKFFEIIGYRAYTVLSGSMEGDFYPGDMIIVKHKDKADIQLNDIVTYKDKEDRIITHKAVDYVDEGFITKGNKNNLNDFDILKEENMIGEVEFRIPKLGYLVIFFSNSKVISIELILLALAILYYCRDNKECSELDKETKKFSEVV